MYRARALQRYPGEYLDSWERVNNLRSRHPVVCPSLRMFIFQFNPSEASEAGRPAELGPPHTAPTAYRRTAPPPDSARDSQPLAPLAINCWLLVD